MTFYKYFAAHVNLISNVLDLTSTAGADNEGSETMCGRDGI